MSIYRFRTQIPTVIAVLFTIAILTGSFFWFSDNTDKMIESSTNFFLEINARSQAAAFRTKLENQIETLSIAEQMWEGVDFSDKERVRHKLMESRELGSFTQVAVSGPDGELMDTHGVSKGNILHSRYFQRVMEGETVISDSVQYTSEDGEYLYIAMPIMTDGAPGGLIYGQFPITVMQNLIQTVGFQESSTSLLLSSDGTIIARSAGNELVTERISNFYDIGTSWGLRGELSLNDIRLDVMSGKTLTIPYKTGSRERIAIMTPVGQNNWYYAIIISQDVIHQQSRMLSMDMLIVILVISFAFAMLFITILHLLRHTSIVEQANDRFRMVTTQTQAIVFDYDFTKKHLELNGNVKLVNKEAKENYSAEEIEEFLAHLLHENDRSVVHDFKALYENTDGHFYWYRLTGAVVRSEEGKALRFVGNFVNVEDEVSKEQLLKQKAEIDPLSGLLNKGAFTNYVNELLAISTDDNLYAFYIIDLDNFKKVNDTLGHIVGDRVISDVAQKLCTVFSENDFVGRIGGDEFAAFLKLSDNGKQIGQKIIEAKANAACAMINEIYSDGKNEVNITSSIGVAVYPRDGRKFEDLYKNADKALYTSKNGGKNQYTICK